VTWIRSNYSLIRDHKYRSLAASKLFGHLSYGNADAITNAIGYAEFYSRSHHAVVRVYDDAGNVIETEVRPRKDHRGVNLISDALPFGALWYGEPNAVSNAIDYAKFRSRSHDAVICVYDNAGNMIETHEHEGEFKEW